MIKMIANKLLKLPIGVQDFEQLRSNNYLYVDKTQAIYGLVTQGYAYFLSRPRRFGKSLLCSTFKALFQGKKHLFQDTWIANSNWSWEKYPIINLDFSKFVYNSSAGLEFALQKNLLAVAQDLDIKIAVNLPGEMLANLVDQLYANGQKVVILIDEYDRPLINHLQDLDQVDAYRKLLKQFYSPIKELGHKLQFLFITGVSQFTQVSIFSDLNHLKNLSNSWQAATICGYVESELSTYFLEYLNIASKKYGCNNDQLLAQIKYWYNGYVFTDPAMSPMRIYNPFSVINFLDELRFDNFWFKSGTPTFIIDYFKDRDFEITDFESVLATDNQLSALLPEKLNITTLLYQTGYLTIKSYDQDSRLFTLGFPNAEVSESCADQLFELVTKKTAGPLFGFAKSLRKAFLEHKLGLLLPTFKKICAYLPYTIHPNNERGYQMIFYLIMQFIGLDVIVEDPTALGRIDAVIKINQRVYLIDLKIRGYASQALEQIVERCYDEKYRAQGLVVTHIGIVFDSSPNVRTVTDIAIK
jgi:hypothetical protein